MERDRGGRPRYPGVLTPAEQRVLDELRNGGSNAEIAARLGLSRETVKTHIASMLSKLDLPDRYALAGWQPEPPRRGARGWLGLLVRPAIGLGAAGGVVALIVVFAVVIGGSRDNAVPMPAPEVNLEGCSGVAVTNPQTNTELVADCEALLGLRDTIRGTGKLNWTAGKAMADWMGVTVSGTPQRVTGLNLSDLGLDGKLSGLLGNLTGLTTLNLSGNALTGMLPSKLALLTSLTTGIAGQGRTSLAVRRRYCAAATNDVAATAGTADVADRIGHLLLRVADAGGLPLAPVHSTSPSRAISGLHRRGVVDLRGAVRGRDPYGIFEDRREGVGLWIDKYGTDEHSLVFYDISPPRKPST